MSTKSFHPTKSMYIINNKSLGRSFRLGFKVKVTLYSQGVTRATPAFVASMDVTLGCSSTDEPGKVIPAPGARSVCRVPDDVLQDTLGAVPLGRNGT